MATDRQELRRAAAAGDGHGARHAASDDPEGRAAVARSEGWTVPAEDDLEAAIHLGHAALIALDPDAARASLGVLDRRGPPAGDRAAAHRLAQASARLVLGATDGELPSSTDARERLDAALLRQLRMDVHEADGALEMARRLTRMARTEGDVDALVIAGVQLARRRRLAGFPYLASRILRQVSSAPGGRWAAWVAWERAMAGGGASDPPFESPAWTAVKRLRGSLAGHEVSDDPPPWAPWARDLRRARLALGRVVSGDDAAADDPVAAWCRGETHGVPFGLVALADVAPEQPAAWVVARAGCPGRRRLRRGPPPEPLLSVTSTRTQTALAELAIHGAAGVDLPAFFRRVYGFGFVPSRHRASLDVLLHRVRTALPPGADFGREGERVYLRHMGLAVPDPRTVVGPEESVLAAIAERSEASARDIADALAIPLRSVQRILRSLAGDGVCQVRGRGPATRYHLEDTTFADPTNLGG